MRHSLWDIMLLLQLLCQAAQGRQRDMRWCHARVRQAWSPSCGAARGRGLVQAPVCRSHGGREGTAAAASAAAAGCGGGRRKRGTIAGVAGISDGSNGGGSSSSGGERRGFDWRRIHGLRWWSRRRRDGGCKSPNSCFGQDAGRPLFPCLPCDKGHGRRLVLVGLLLLLPAKELYVGVEEEG